MNACRGTISSLTAYTSVGAEEANSIIQGYVVEHLYARAAPAPVLKVNDFNHAKLSGHVGLSIGLLLYCRNEVRNTQHSIGFILENISVIMNLFSIKRRQIASSRFSVGSASMLRM